MFWKQQDGGEKKITPAEAKETFVHDLAKLIAKCREAGTITEQHRQAAIVFRTRGGQQ
jgi:hypothetical protein